jgi:hypothetical protein
LKHSGEDSLHIARCRITSATVVRGFLPIIATSLVARTGNIYAGLAFLITVAHHLRV